MLSRGEACPTSWAVPHLSAGTWGRPGPSHRGCRRQGCSSRSVHREGQPWCTKGQEDVERLKPFQSGERGRLEEALWGPHGEWVPPSGSGFAGSQD